MLKQRTLTALALIPLALMIILLPPTWLFAAIISIALLGALWEWTNLCGLTSPVSRGAVLAVGAALFLALWLVQSPGLLHLIIAAGVAWWVLAYLWLQNFAFAAAPTHENRALKLVTGAFVIVPTWAAALSIHASEPHGHWWMLLALVIVWSADTGAYFSGRFFGKRKLAPQISPGKTWAGVVGALIAGAIAAAIGGWLLDVRSPGQILGLAVLALVTVAASIIGDLFESLMKRHASVKDSGTLIPGHGGLLDRLDSVFAALPVFAAGKLLLGL
jgi:phosphatidate cytidylyltransferase